MFRPVLAMAPLLQMTEAERTGTYSEHAELFAKRGGRSAMPEEVAGIVAMLCSADAALCTGQIICANGGMVFNR